MGIFCIVSNTLLKYKSCNSTGFLKFIILSINVRYMEFLSILNVKMESYKRSTDSHSNFILKQKKSFLLVPVACINSFRFRNTISGLQFRSRPCQKLHSFLIKFKVLHITASRRAQEMGLSWTPETWLILIILSDLSVVFSCSFVTKETYRITLQVQTCLFFEL